MWPFIKKMMILTNQNVIKKFWNRTSLRKTLLIYLVLMFHLLIEVQARKQRKNRILFLCVEKIVKWEQTQLFSPEEILANAKLKSRGGVEDTRLQAIAKDTKKNPRPRPRTAFTRTESLEAKDRNARG